MKLRITTILFLSILTVLISCKGQVKSESEQLNITENSIGQVVNKLDPKANLIYHDREDNKWFGSQEVGIYRYDGETLVLFTSKDGLVSHRIISVQEDKDGNLYFDTPSGISKYDGSEFSTLEVKQNDNANNWKLEPNDLWFRMGWDKSGPYRYDGTKLYHLEFPKAEMEEEFYAKYPNVSYNPYGIYCLFKDSKGHIWLGTSSMGIYHYDGRKISWMYERHLTETPGGGDFGIRSIIEDKKGFYWICNTDYKYKVLLDNTENSILNELNILRETGLKVRDDETEYFLSAATDNDGQLWMQTYDTGVWQNTGKKLIHHPIKDGEDDVLIASIYKDQKGEIWVGTQDKGAYKYNGKAFEKFNLK